MIICDLHVVGVTVDKAKADTPLIVDGYGVLALAIPLQGMEMIAARYAQVVQGLSKIDVL